jgi:uncharacterized membrane protein YvlD (DUF360 family)
LLLQAWCGLAQALALLLVLTPLPEQIRPALALLALPVLLLLLLFQLLRLRQLLQAQRW